jgi:hypothetical protein
MDRIGQGAELRLAAQIALLGMITRNVRAVLCRLEDHTIRLRCVFDGMIEEADRERMEEVASEVISHFPEVTQIHTSCESANASSGSFVEEGWLLVFLRAEE